MKTNNRPSIPQINNPQKIASTFLYMLFLLMQETPESHEFGTRKRASDQQKKITKPNPKKLKMSKVIQSLPKLSQLHLHFIRLPLTPSRYRSNSLHHSHIPQNTPKIHPPRTPTDSCQRKNSKAT